MKILALITDAGEGKGGIARFNQDFLSALSSTPSITVIVFSRLPFASTFSFGRGGKVGRGGKMRYAFSVFKSFYTEGPFDLIFCGHLALSPLAAFISKIQKIPYWLQLHGIEVLMKPSPILCWAVKQAALVTAVSRYTRQRFLSWACVSPEKVRVLPNTVGQKFHPGPKPEYLLKRYGLLGKKVILTLSRLSSAERYKGQDRVMNILPKLLESEPTTVYVIAGEGDDRKRLEGIARQKKLNGAVRFIGPVKESELADHYRMADLFVMPSTGEGFGIVFLEAAACGIPVIAGSEDGSRDPLLDGAVGRLVKPNDPEGLMEAILESLHKKPNPTPVIQRFSQKNFSSLVNELVKEALRWS